MGINGITSSPSYDLLKEGLKASTVRGKAIANNIANINTKGFKREVVTFEENLKGEMSKLELKKTNKKHLSGNNITENIGIGRDESTSMRLDGNNVDLDIEKVNQAANTLKYNSLVQMTSGKLNNISYIIKGGR